MQTCNYNRFQVLFCIFDNGLFGCSILSLQHISNGPHLSGSPYHISGSITGYALLLSSVSTCKERGGCRKTETKGHDVVTPSCQLKPHFPVPSNHTSRVMLFCAKYYPPMPPRSNKKMFCRESRLGRPTQ